MENPKERSIGLWVLNGEREVLLFFEQVTLLARKIRRETFSSPR